MQIKILAEGGEMKPGPALSQQLGPAGINISQVIEKVNEATKNFKGLKVPVELDVDTSTKTFEVKVFSPPVSELLKSELGIKKGSGKQKKVKLANASIEQIISVANTKLPNLLCNNLKTAVKTVVGSCVSLGVLIENKSAKEIEAEIDEGKYDEQIKNITTETPAEKKEELDNFFAELKSKQDKLIQIEQAAKAAEEEKTKKAAPVAASTTPEKTPTKEPAKKK